MKPSAVISKKPEEIKDYDDDGEDLAIKLMKNNRTNSLGRI